MKGCFQKEEYPKYNSQDYRSYHATIDRKNAIYFIFMEAGKNNTYVYGYSSKAEADTAFKYASFHAKILFERRSTISEYDELVEVSSRYLPWAVQRLRLCALSFQKTIGKWTRYNFPIQFETKLVFIKNWALDGIENSVEFEYEMTETLDETTTVNFKSAWNGKNEFIVNVGPKEKPFISDSAKLEFDISSSVIEESKIKKSSSTKHKYTMKTNSKTSDGNLYLVAYQVVYSRAIAIGEREDAVRVDIPLHFKSKQIVLQYEKDSQSIEKVIKPTQGSLSFFAAPLNKNTLQIPLEYPKE